MLPFTFRRRKVRLYPVGRIHSYKVIEIHTNLSLDFALRILSESRAEVEYDDTQGRRTAPQDLSPGNGSVNEFRTQDLAVAQVIRRNCLAGLASSPCRVGPTGIFVSRSFRSFSVGGQHSGPLPCRDQVWSFMALVSDP